MNLASSLPPTSFQTERLIIRRCDPDFEEDLFQAGRASIKEMYPFLPWCHPGYSKLEARQWLAFAQKQWQEGKTFGFSIFDQQGRLLGGCGVSKIDEHPVANLGYWVRTDVTGRGIATEATVGLATFAFKYLELLRLEIIMSVKNLASQRVAINAGATFEATLKNRLLLHGQSHDAHLYSLTPQPISQ